MLGIAFGSLAEPLDILGNTPGPRWAVEKLQIPSLA